MGEKEINEILKTILGADAFNNGDFQVSSDISKLAKAVNYLTIQIRFTAQMVDTGEAKEHVKGVLLNTKEILTK